MVGTTPANNGRLFAFLGHPLGQGFAISGAVLILATVAGLAGEVSFWNVVIKQPYKLAFVAGMLLSVFAQTAVSTFLEANKLLDCVPVWKLLSPLSNVVLGVLALFAIASVDNYWKHVSCTIVYLALIVLLDIIVWIQSREAIEVAKLARKIRKAKIAGLCARICKSMFLKLDLVSLLGVSALAWAASGLQRQFGAAGQAALSPEDLASHSDMFLSGAVGFHLLMTVALILSLLRDWDEDVKRLRIGG